MGKKYNTRLIRNDYSYYVEQIADLYEVDIATVRRWIREDGLERIPKTRPHLVHSSVLKAFLDKKQAKKKKPCVGNEIFCFSCQKPRNPRLHSGVAVQLPNNSIRFQAKCSDCGGKMNRTIRAAEWAENHPLAVYLSDASREHNGVEPPHHECSLQQEEKR
jgi:hypothetical protein